MGSCASKEAEGRKRQPLNDKVRLQDDLDRIKQEQERALDAETITVAIKGPDGKVDDVSARLNGSIQELAEQVGAKYGVTNEFVEYLELHFCNYQLQPVTKTVREFTELCEVTSMVRFAALIDCARRALRLN